MVTPAELTQRIDQLQAQCDADGARLRATLRGQGHPQTGTAASATELGQQLIANRLELIRLRQQHTTLRAHHRRANSATRN